MDAIWLTLCDPASAAYAAVGSRGLERPVLDYLGRPSPPRDLQPAAPDRARSPISVTELPVPVAERPTWADCLIPANVPDGVEVPLSEPGGPYVGLLSLLFADRETPSSDVRACLAGLAPLIARGVSPTRSLHETARLVDGATGGVVVLRNGTTHPLPGLAEYPLPGDDSPLVALARQTLLAGAVYRTFLWPSADTGAAGHARMTVLAATDAPDFVLGALLVTPHADCRGLTPRELEVLGLVVEGCSNQQIAFRLCVALRTVATHVEHILHKLEVPTRTLAAVQAEREGCHVPPHLGRVARQVG